MDLEEDTTQKGSVGLIGRLLDDILEERDLKPELSRRVGLADYYGAGVVPFWSTRFDLRLKVVRDALQLPVQHPGDDTLRTVGGARAGK